MKTAIFFDSFTLGGGAERLVLSLAKTLNADVYTSGYTAALYKDWVGKTRVFDIGNIMGKFSSRVGFIESALRFALFKPKQDYDLYIFSGFFSIFAAWRHRRNIWYCFQPNRTIFDLKEFQKAKSGVLGKLLIEAYALLWKPIDRLTVKNRIKKIVCISETVRKRVKKYYGLESQLIFPPIETEKYWFGKFGNFFFFAGRLIPEKRVELLLETFAELPEKKLAIAGIGPLQEKVEAYCKNFPNIAFLGRVSEAELREQLANCLATIYLPVQEDFGMFPLEGNSAGKACIAAKEGGCTETVIDGKTGFLIAAKQTELAKVIEHFSQAKAQKMKQDCINQAKNFSEERFAAEWKKFLKSNFNRNDCE